MKFRTYLETIAGVGIYPLVSLIIFFAFFVCLLLFVFRIDKKDLQNMESIPLKDGVVQKSLLSLLFLILLSSSAFAADDAEPIRAITGTELILYMFLGVLFFIAVLVVILLANAVSLLKQVSQNNAASVTTEPKVSWWKKFAGMSVMPGDDKQLLIEGHDYDGIQELDNRMPPWLQSLFLATIVIGLAYAAFYFSGMGDLQLAELDKEVAQAEIDKKAYMAKVGASMDENTVTLVTDAGTVDQGKTIFVEKCAACHAPDGGGSVGPNLTDGYWLHGAGINNIFKVIKYGVPEKGMISWEKQLSPTDIQKVASYVISLKGSKPATPKEPQGDLVQENGLAQTDK
ncbi:cbb3-type cytochrome c oxidase N-terminal domain-containing protein [Dyadobacter sp. CY323]|uniref:cbb3-type cytochrome c oxidase N-terminal domain-containing protein n=1 Tax=Dyadobacter sp. CY323 TaxID=2907302 RepID=UPI001F461330|nr:cbb3-type cytochrome c oxidase N-terminal domain-containing protein [Dyadobacter sp. CY323]MCE6991879.1 c-type cytochrome [Dyadobacter sp. CY323]